MKKLILLFIVFGSLAYSQAPRGATYFQFKKLGTNPTLATDTNKADLFFKYSGTAGDTGLYRRFQDGSVKRIDSVGSFNTRQDTVFFRVGVVSRGTVTTTDSLREFVIPVGSTIRIDSLKQWASNPSSLTYKLYKNVAGSVSQITNGNVSITSSVTSTGGLQNNTSLTGNTELWVVITGGTADRARIEIIFKNQ